MSNSFKIGAVLLLLTGCSYKNHLYRNSLLYSNYSYTKVHRIGSVSEKPTVILIANKSRHENDGFISINDRAESIYHFSHSECNRNQCTWFGSNSKVRLTYNYRAGLVWVDSISQESHRFSTFVIDSAKLNYSWLIDSPKPPAILQDSVTVSYSGF